MWSITQRQRLSQTQKPRNQKGIVNPTKIRKKERKKKERKKERGGEIRRGGREMPKRVILRFQSNTKLQNLQYM
jgi:hypothetical protein